MKIYIAHSSGFDFENEFYGPLKDSDFAKNHELIFPHAGEGVSNSKETIKAADVIIAEVSYPSTGEGIELGWADVFGKRIVCCHKKGVTISSALDFIKSEKIEYADSSDLIAQLNSVMNHDPLIIRN